MAEQKQRYSDMLWQKAARFISQWKMAIQFNPKDYWTKRGCTYIKEYPPGGQRGEELILSTLEKIEFNSLLDVGCGYGRYCKHIAEHFSNRQIAGVDISSTQIEQAKKYLREHAGVELREIDGEHLPYPDKSFDISFTYGCMIHVPDNKIYGFFEEIARVTRGKGLYIESSRKGRKTLKQILSPSVIWYSHDHDKLFRHFHRPYEIIAEWEPAPGYIERLYLVDFIKESVS